MNTSTIAIALDGSDKKSKNPKSKNSTKPDYIVSVHTNTVLYYTKVDKNKNHKQRVDNSIIEEIVLPEDYE